LEARARGAGLQQAHDLGACSSCVPDLRKIGSDRV